MKSSTARISKSGWNGGQSLTTPAEHFLVQWLGQIIDAMLALSIIAAPLFMGGRGPIGRCVFVGLVCAAAIAWFTRSCFLRQAKWRWSGVEWLILLGGTLIVLQLIPLPPSLLQKVSPAIGQLLPLWQGDSSTPGTLGTWSTISLTPEDTRGGLATYLAYALLFLVLVQRLETIADVETLMKCLAVAAVLMAAVGMLQLMFGNGKFLWIYEHPRRDTFVKVNGTFQNQNHFAHFLALGLGPLLWWLQRIWCVSLPKAAFTGSRRSAGRHDMMVRNGLALALAVVVVASLLSYSRGGVLAVGVVIGLTVAIYYWKSLLGTRSLIGLAAFGGLIALTLAIYGHDLLAAKLSSLLSGSVEEMSQSRMDLWRADIKAIRLFPILGTGVGSHRDVYPLFMDKHYSGVFTHAENGYIQLLLETGSCGLILGLTAFAIVLRWCSSLLLSRSTDLRFASLAGPVLAAGVASLFHAWGDFAWYIPACMTLTLALAAIACRLSQMQKYQSDGNSNVVASWENVSYLPRLAWGGLAAAVLLLSIAAVNNRIGPALASPHADACLRLEEDRIDFNPANAELNRQKLAALEDHLRRLTANHPKDARALLDLAQICLTRFELEQQFSANPMILSQIRDAALASSFPSREAQDEWLNVAIGENRKWIDLALQSCKKALTLSPLQGHGYVHLADLCFLETSQGSAKQALIAQAATVRPHSGLVQFALGKEAALNSDFESAIAHWRKAFKNDPLLRKPIIEKAAAWMPANEVLNTFQPDADTLGELVVFYQALQRDDEARLVAQTRVAVLQAECSKLDSEAAAHKLDQAAAVLVQFGSLEDAIKSQSRAVELSPNNFEMRRSLGLYLAHANRLAEGMVHLEWCARRRPDDTRLHEDLAHLKHRMADSGGAQARLDR